MPHELVPTFSVGARYARFEIVERMKRAKQSRPARVSALREGVIRNNFPQSFSQHNNEQQVTPPDRLHRSVGRAGFVRFCGQTIDPRTPSENNSPRGELRESAKWVIHELHERSE